MITMIEGAIGSGKTYYAVSEILRLYYHFNESTMEYVLNDDVNLEIITNIDNFRYGLSLKEEIDSAGGIEKFFNKDYQSQRANLKKIVYVIDECQEFFDRKFYNKSVFNFFQSSRRIGVDIYLITQDIYSVAREIATLSEHHIKVARRSNSLFGEFRYSYMSGNEVFKKKNIRPDQKVFMQYRSSFAGSDIHKPSKFASKYYIYVILLFIGIFAGGYGFLWLLAGDAWARKTPPAEKVFVNSLSSDKKGGVGVRLGARSKNYDYYISDTGVFIRKVKRVNE